MPREYGLGEQEAVETALGSRFPWLPESDLATVSNVFIKRWAELGVDQHDTFTPQLLISAQHVGAELGQMIGSAPPMRRETHRGNVVRRASESAWEEVRASWHAHVQQVRERASERGRSEPQ